MMVLIFDQNMKRVHQFSTKEAELLWNKANQMTKTVWAPFIKGAGTEDEIVEPVEWKRENQTKLEECARLLLQRKKNIT